MTFVDQILKKYNLEKLDWIREAGSKGVRSHVILAQDSRNKKYSVKVFSTKDNQAKQRFINEIGYIRSIRSALPKRFKSWMPVIKWYSKSGENPYYIYSYIDYQQLGFFVADFGIKWGNFRHNNFKNFIDFFDVKESINDEELSVEPGSWGYRTARKELQSYFENVNNLLPSELYDKIVSFNHKYQKIAFEKKVLSHRDLYPENILIAKPGDTKFAFLDWEYLSFVPIGFNAAFLYLLFWREEYWKAKVFSHFYHRYAKQNDADSLKTFIASFRFCLISLGVRFLYQIEAFGDKGTEDYIHARLSFISAIEDAISGEIATPRNIKFFLDKEDIEEVSALYGIDKIYDYEIFYASKGNTVVKVLAKVGGEKRKLIFRFYSQSRSRSLILRELNIFIRLSETDIKSYDVIPSIKGELFVEYKLYGKVRRIAVLSYLEGKKIQQKWANAQSSKNAGKTLRLIHDSNVIHGDFSKENLLFRKTKVSGVIDFEWGRFTTSKQAKFFDLAKAVALWLVDVRGKNIKEDEFVTEFIFGYYGEDVSKQKFKRICEAVIVKINDEKSIFMTTIDRRFSSHKVLGSRFDVAVRVIEKLLD